MSEQAADRIKAHFREKAISARMTADKRRREAEEALQAAALADHAACIWEAASDLAVDLLEPM